MVFGTEATRERMAATASRSPRARRLRWCSWCTSTRWTFRRASGDAQGPAADGELPARLLGRERAELQPRRDGATAAFEIPIRSTQTNVLVFY